MGLPAPAAGQEAAAQEKTAAETPAPRFTLQVSAKQIVVRVTPDANARALAAVSRGQELNADLQQGDWFRIPVAGPNGRGMGWVKQEEGEYGDLVLEVSVARDINPTPLLIGTDDYDPLDDDAITHNIVNGQRQAVAVAPVYDSQLPPPEAALPRESVPVPDRWRIMQALDFRFPFYDPYHQNVLKGDLPVAPGHFPEWFFSLGLISDTTYEMRRLPVPVAPQTSANPLSLIHI